LPHPTLRGYDLFGISRARQDVDLRGLFRRAFPVFFKSLNGAFINRELIVVNASATQSLEEGLEETVTLHPGRRVPGTGGEFQDHEADRERDVSGRSKTAKVDCWRTRSCAGVRPPIRSGETVSASERI
jgi:hypothetical protein